MWLTSDILLHRGQPRGIPMCARLQPRISQSEGTSVAQFCGFNRSIQIQKPLSLFQDYSLRPPISLFDAALS